MPSLQTFQISYRSGYIGVQWSGTQLCLLLRIFRLTFISYRPYICLLLLFLVCVDWAVWALLPSRCIASKWCRTDISATPYRHQYDVITTPCAAGLWGDFYLFVAPLKAISSNIFYSGRWIKVLFDLDMDWNTLLVYVLCVKRAPATNVLCSTAVLKRCGAISSVKQNLHPYKHYGHVRLSGLNFETLLIPNISSIYI